MKQYKQWSTKLYTEN